MKKYTVLTLPSAIDDMEDIYHYITHDAGSPLAALNYYNGIIDTIESLSNCGASIAISQNASIQQRYGPKARTILYKKVVIVYNILDDIIYVRRVMASSQVR